MKTTVLKAIVAAASISGAMLLDAMAADAASPDATVSVDSPSKAEAAVDSPPKAVAAQAAADATKPQVSPLTHKFEWQTEEAKQRLQGQGASNLGSSKKEPSKKPLAPYEGPPAWRLIVAFAIMSLLLYGLYLFLKRFGKKISGQDGSGLKLVSRLKIDSRNSLAVVQFHEDELLIAVNSGGGLQLISKCSQLELAEAEANAGGVEETDARGESFSSDEEAALHRHFDGLKPASSFNIDIKAGKVEERR